MFETFLRELGISLSTAIIMLIALFFIIKGAVKSALRDIYKDITGKELETGAPVFKIVIGEKDEFEEDNLIGDTDD